MIELDRPPLLRCGARLSPREILGYRSPLQASSIGGKGTGWGAKMYGSSSVLSKKDRRAKGGTIYSSHSPGRISPSRGGEKKKTNRMGKPGLTGSYYYLLFSGEQEEREEKKSAATTLPIRKQKLKRSTLDGGKSTPRHTRKTSKERGEE